MTLENYLYIFIFIWLDQFLKYHFAAVKTSMLDNGLNIEIAGSVSSKTLVIFQVGKSPKSQKAIQIPSKF